MRRTLLTVFFTSIWLLGGFSVANGQSSDPETRYIIPDWPELNYAALNALNVQHAGRKKPYYAFAWENMLTLSGRTSLTFDDGRKIDAVTLMTSIWMGERDWYHAPLIQINSQRVKDRLGLEVMSRTSRFSFREIVDRPEFNPLLDELQQHIADNRGEIKEEFYQDVNSLGQRLQLLRSLINGQPFRIIPHPTEPTGTWQTLDDEGNHFSDRQLEPLRNLYLGLHLIYKHPEKEDRLSFSEVAGLMIEQQHKLAPEMMLSDRAVSTELWYKETHPFRWAAIFSFLSALALAGTWRFAQRSGLVVGYIFAGLSVAYMVAGMTARVIISGRAPVTNMYETVIWVAFGLLVFAFIFEARYRCRYYLVSAAPLAAFMLLLADYAPLILDPAIAPLTPVLRDNFWLTTHVLTVTISYAAFALAFALGHFILGKQILKGGRMAINADLYAYIYRILQVGIVLLLVGVLLGAVWANYSWGRFWDWDPKETASLVALLGYLFVLHGRFAGWWSGFGFSVGAVVGFQGIIMCWYGVNFIWGVGLHSYGFGSGGLGLMIGLIIFEVFFVGLAILRRYVLTGSSTGGPPNQKSSSSLPGSAKTADAQALG